MVRLLLVDSGTTNTRLRLTEDGRVVRTLRRAVGARDGHDALKAGLADLFAEAAPFGAEAALLSGMITSPTGLWELPHVPGPLDLSALSPVRHDFPELTPLPLLFIPGVRLGEAGGLLAEADVIRGEETELAGYLALHGARQTRLFLHLGSHHKAMRTEGARLTRSATALTGELLSAVSGHTILSSSLKLGDTAAEEWVLRGAEEAEKAGLARALFLVRILDIREHASETARYSFALGALAREDLRMLTADLADGVEEAVIYGQPAFAAALRLLWQRRYPHLPLHILSEEESDSLAPAGALSIYAGMEKNR